MKKELTNLQNDSNEKKVRKLAWRKLDMITSSRPLSLLKHSTLKQADVDNKTDLVNRAVGQLFYGAGLSFNLANNKLFKDAVEAIRCAPKDYKVSISCS